MNEPAEALDWIHYLPMATTLVAAVFCGVLVHRFRRKGRGAHLIWWAAGVACFGTGTALESAITLGGNTPGLNKAWYVAGAVLGAYPLAQGTVFLLFQRRTAWRLTAVTLPVVFAVSALVIASPVEHNLLEPHRPSGRVLGWTWVRMLTPLINVYALIFLAGGAALSAWRFAKRRATAGRAVGNTLIAGGAVLPGIGGTMARIGSIEPLYVTELIGLTLIWIGYAACVRTPTPPTSRERNTANPR